MLITKLQHCPNAEVIIVASGKSRKGRFIGLICRGCYEVLASDTWKH